MTDLKSLPQKLYVEEDWEGKKWIQLLHKDEKFYGKVRADKPELVIKEASKISSEYRSLKELTPFIRNLEILLEKTGMSYEQLAATCERVYNRLKKEKLNLQPFEYPSLYIRSLALIGPIFIAAGVTGLQGSSTAGQIIGAVNLGLGSGFLYVSGKSILEYYLTRRKTRKEIRKILEEEGIPAKRLLEYNPYSDELKLTF